MGKEDCQDSVPEEISAWQDQLDCTSADIAYFRAPHVELKLSAHDVLSDFQSVILRLEPGVIYRIEFPQKPLASYPPLWQEILKRIKEENQSRKTQQIHFWQDYQEQGIIEIYLDEPTTHIR